MLYYVHIINFHVVVVIVMINIGEYDASFNIRCAFSGVRRLHCVVPSTYCTVLQESSYHGYMDHRTDQWANPQKCQF